MSTKPVNPNNIKRIDTETTGIPTGYSGGRVDPKTGLYTPEDLSNAIDRFKNVDITQVGINTSTSTTHQSVILDEHKYIAKKVGKDVTGYEVINGIRIPVRQYVVETANKEELLDFLSKDGKLTKHQIAAYSNSAGQVYIRRGLKVVTETTLANGKILAEDKWAFMQHIGSGEYGPNPVSNVKEKLGKEFSHLSIPYESISDADFRGKGKNSLYNLMEGWVDKSNTEKVSIGIHNPAFDIDLMRAKLVEFGYPQLVQEFDLAVSNGTILLPAMQHDWQLISFRLMKENPEMRSAFRIRPTPESFKQFGSRIGMRANTFEEFMASTNKWSLQGIADVFSWHPSVQSVLGGGAETHISSLDSALSGVLDDTVYPQLLQRVNTQLQKTGQAPLKSIKELRTLKSDSKVLTEALKSLIKDSGENLSGKEINDIAKKTLSKTEAPARRLAEYDKPLVASYTKALNKVTHSSPKLAYGVPAILGAAALYSVYGLGGDERSGTFLNKFPALGNIVGAIFNRQIRHGRINDSVEKRTHLLKTLALGIGTPLMGLYAAGYVAAKAKPNLFGISKPINSLGDAVNSFFRTTLYGAKKMEDAISLTRIARVSDLFSYLFSDRSYGQLPNGTWRGKNFDVITKSAKGNSYIQGRFGHGVYTDDLMSAAQTTSTKEELFALQQWLEPSKIPEDVSRRIARVSIDEKGRAIVFGEEYGLDGKPLSGGLRDTFKKGITVNAEISMTAVRHHGINKGPKLYANSFAYHKMQRDLAEGGDVWKRTVEEVMKEKGLPIDPKSFRYWEEQLKLSLEIGPKGVNEAANIMFNNMDRLSKQTETLIHVKSLTGKWRWSLENLKFLGKFAGPIAQSYTIEGMNKFLETPFEFLGADQAKINAFASKLKGSSNVLSRGLGRAVSFISAPHLGLPLYNIKGGMAGYLEQFALKRVLPAVAAFEGLRFLDHALGALTMSPTGRGPLTNIPIKAYEGLSLLYSKVSDITGMTSVAKKQEAVAPGTTGLGLFAPAASLAATTKIAELFYSHGPKSLIAPMRQLQDRIFGSSTFLSEMRQVGTNAGVFASRTNLQKALSWGLHNPKKGLFAVGMLPLLPFVPGLLGSNKTYAERKAEFQGKKEVAIRKNRGWLLSTSPIQGNRVTHFRESATSLIQKDWENRGVVWPSYWQRFAHNVTGGLYGRYMLENYHKNSQPTYQSAPYGANLPLVGPFIAGTVGHIIKPTIDYHKFADFDNTSSFGDKLYSQVANSNQRGLSAFGLGRNGIDASKLNTSQLARHIGLTSENSTFSLTNKFARSLHDFIGFRGFGYETVRSAITGMKSPDEFTPYAQGAGEMYNTAQQMWQYNAGDVTLIGGEFLRRIFQYPEKRWTVNNIPNELNGTSWIPQGKSDIGKSSKRDLTHGTTFDKVPMGWLYGTRKGWELLHPEVKGLDLEQYPDPVRLDILSHLAPYSTEFSNEAQKVKWMALGNKLDPEQEQRYYETLKQVGEQKDQLYATENESGYSVKTATVKGRITETDGEGRFSLDSMGDRTFRLAGVSLEQEDIRAKLLQTHKFDNSDELSQAMQDTINRTSSLMNSVIRKGNVVSVEVPTMSQMVGSGEVEATLGKLNTMLIDKGAGYVNTGNLSKYNIFQQLHGIPGKMLSKYWSHLSEGESFWINKLSPKRDYLSHYKYSNVYNRDVKLWNHPIEQIFKPMIASTLHKFGIDSVPQFTINRRRNQEYWDVLKYIKGKMLEVKTRDPEYRDMWKSTMLGADPIHDNMQSLMKAIPENERAWFDRFANEPNPKKRGNILKLIPAAQRRIYTSIWAKNQHAGNLGNKKGEQEYWEEMAETEGFGKTKREESQWRAETDGITSFANWKRAKYIEQYAKTHYIPDAHDQIWRPDVDIDNVELLSLRADGENVEDYGFFEDKIRISAFDSRANQVALQLKSNVLTMSSSVGSVLPYISSNYDAKADGNNSMPSSTINGIMNNSIVTDQFQRALTKNLGGRNAIFESIDSLLLVALRR